MSRDPIGENGGAGLYLMVHNSPLDGVDPNGLKPKQAEEQNKTYTYCPCSNKDGDALAELLKQERCSVEACCRRRAGTPRRDEHGTYQYARTWIALWERPFGAKHGRENGRFFRFVSGLGRLE